MSALGADLASEVNEVRPTRGLDSGPWVPTLTDAAFVAVLSGLGLFSFRNLYGGAVYLLLGLIGVLLGLAIAGLGARVRVPVLAEAASVAVVYFLVGGALVARTAAVGGLIPSTHSLSVLLRAAVFGWKELLTTAPPVGNSASLLAIPFLVGLVGGVVGQSLAERTRVAALPLLGPGLVLAIGILFGSRIPTSLFLQGVVFGGIALVWVAIRFHRVRPVITGGGVGRSRLALASGMVVAAVLVAGPLGPELPGAHSHSRVVLSRYVVPPFDVNNQPSPLAGFRQYARTGADNQKVLFTVRGLRTGAPVRIATMDEYDGLVWGFGTAGDGSAPAASTDVFQKYGSTIPAGQIGRSATIAVTIDDLSGVWMPNIGETTRVTFAGPAAASLQAAYRYDPETLTAAEPKGLQQGDTYRLNVVVPPTPTPQQLYAAAAGSDVLSLSDIPPVVRSDAEKWAGQGGAWGRVDAIAKHLKQAGKFSDGDETPTLSLPGANAGRLAAFLQGGGLVGNQIVGDDEQYAAALALMANAVGVPARVVLGADVGQDGMVKGSDVHAWIEVSLAGLGWVPLYQNSFLPSTPPIKNPPVQTPQQTSSAPIQPPVVSTQHSPLNDALPGSTDDSTSANRRPAPGPLVPAWLITAVRWLLPPVAVVALIVGSIRGIKHRRRMRRRRAGRPSTQIAGAWAELVDLARDLGGNVPARGTRLEQANHLEAPGAVSLAGQVDGAIFGPDRVTPAEVEAFWKAVDGLAAEQRQRLTLWRRWRAALSLRSLRLSPTAGGMTP